MKQVSSCPVILLIVIAFLIFPVLVFSSSIPLIDLKIPSQIGTIKEIFQPDAINSQNNPIIIQIQDAHCNYEAQKNLATILEYLIKEKNVKLVMVEGGSGDVTLAFLRDYADKKERELIADKYLRRGQISGEEYLDIVSDYNFELYGIEDPGLYENNLESFLNIDTFRADALNDSSRLRKIVDALKNAIYNEELKAFEQVKTKYENKEITLADYVGHIKQTAERIEVKTQEYPHFEAFAKSAQLEKEIDFKQAEAERGIFIKELAKLLDEGEVKELIAQTQNFKAKKISPVEYYEFLKTKAENKIDLKQAYPQLDAYLAYTQLGNQVKPEDLIKETNELEKEIRKNIFVNNDEKNLSLISDSLGMLDRFLKLDLTPREYDDFQARKDEFRTGSWIKFLADNCSKYGIAENPQIAVSIDDNIDKFNEFYKIGLEREQSFLKNITDKMSLSQDKIAVVITGGFHTPGMSKLFKEHGYSYAVVTPSITQKADSAIYYSVLRGDRGEIEDTYLAED
jgi:riboflavin biosynthesis pyrimidine reductase